ncbi:cytohesin-1-like [Protobothrops mucrosquamatus]|uniref:cytohesin-1-like n=1 Tax=Protobothrops mucrosquamatus TaxID=103944 RepID=UPI000775985E|nr:cytohesin-1-like [Protobothrops mucrosquamatus]
MVLRMESVPTDLTPEECQELENIRRRKQELLADIQRLKDEIAEVTNEIENLGSTEERKNMQRNKQVAMGRKKFNMDPKKGIQFLIENDLLKNTCEDIAQFLYKGEGLNKTAIGDYLGERDEFNIQVLHSFVELHEFTDLNLVQALRQFLWSFRLPGEAQKIDRMMEAFAQRYCQCNPGVFQSTDTCYVLSFAIIMLNTSLHNPNVKDKPTVERFIAMNRGINDGGDLPEELLRVSFGIQFLIENDLLKNTCEDIAQFLYKGEGLNKTAIGDYLGERDEFNIQVLHSFVELHEFTDLNLVQALRQFLWSFRLPGEAQKIDRMMEAFAQRYCQCNPGVFQSTGK